MNGAADEDGVRAPLLPPRRAPETAGAADAAADADAPKAAPPKPRRRVAPNWLRRGARLAAALFLFTFAAGTLFFVRSPALKEEWGDELRQSLLWGAATCAAVSQGVLTGAVVQRGSERAVGTAVGGLLGFVFFDYVYKNPLTPDEWDMPMLAAAAALLGLASCWLAERLKADNAARLMVITFVIGARRLPCLSVCACMCHDDPAIRFSSRQLAHTRLTLLRLPLP